MRDRTRMEEMGKAKNKAEGEKNVFKHMLEQAHPTPTPTPTPTPIPTPNQAHARAGARAVASRAAGAVP